MARITEQFLTAVESGAMVEPARCAQQLAAEVRRLRHLLLLAAAPPQALGDLEREELGAEAEAIEREG